MKVKYAFIGLCMTFIFFMFSCSKKYGYHFGQGYEVGNSEDTVSLNVDTNRFKIDYSKYTQARMFPGIVSEKEPRLENVPIIVDLDYQDIRASNLRISVAPGNWQSTGMYAPAGELMVIEVPAGIYGLTAQIGAHHVNTATGIDFPQRDLDVMVRQILFPGKNYVRNLYGGLMYILPERPLGQKVTLLFSGAVKAPSFKLGETTNEEWHEIVDKTTVPWFELEGNRVVFTLETSKLKRAVIKDPTLLMETWDDMIKRAYWDWTGMTEGNPDIRHRAPFNKWRIVHDVLLKKGVGMVSGYPIRGRNNDNGFSQITKVDAVKYSNWGPYHEMGHNMQMNSTWNFLGNLEVTCNLFSFRVSNLHGEIHRKMPALWDRALPYIKAYKSAELKADQTNFASIDLSGNPYKAAAHDIRLVMYAQIFEKYGYDFMTYLYKRGREARFTSANDQSKVDFFYEALSEYTKTDMEYFLTEGWGVFPSAVAKKYIKEEKGLMPLTESVWLYNPATRTGGDEPYVYKIRGNPLPRTNWTATASNNQNNADQVPAKMLDDNASTFWHACWSAACKGADFKIPNWQINVVTGTSAVRANGFFFQQRQIEGGVNHIRSVKVEISTNGTTWKNMGSYSLDRDLTAQYIFFKADDLKHREELRYLRLSITRNDLYLTTNYPAIAELGLFTY